MLSLAAGKLKDRKITLLTEALSALIPIIVGSLGVSGILSGVQVGWGILAPTLIAASLGCCAGCYWVVRDITKHQQNVSY